MRFRMGLALLTALAVGGCERPEVSVPIGGTGEAEYDSAALERARLDTTWQMWAERDRGERGLASGDDASRGAGAARADDPSGADADTTDGRSGGDGDTADTGATPNDGAAESFETISPAAVNSPPRLPVDGGAGPSILRVQIMLDNVDFSPGILDGRWGKNTEKAVYWFQHQQGLETTGVVDRETYERLAALAADAEPVMTYGLTSDDVDGPFVTIPGDVYDRAELSCMCYESPLEMLTEKFHSTPEVLRQLNPGVDFGDLEEGVALNVPNVEHRDPGDPELADIDRIVVSRQGYYTHALDADGNILFHAPSTLGSSYDPSPTGDYRVVAITHDPHFHYQPELFHEVPDENPTAMLPPGPNSPVGVVWMALSKPHYGIHGTSEPRTIGYTSSHGCIRLTNWDAEWLAERTGEPTPVEFR